MPEWRTFSIRVNPRSRKAVAVQARFPLTEEEWTALSAGLELIRLGQQPVSWDVSVSARTVERLAVKP